MKLTAIILLSACLAASAKGFTQTFDLDVKNAPLAKVFQEIEKQTGYSFVYANNLVDKAKNVTLHLKNSTLEEALEKCFKDQPFTYKIINKVIIVNTKEEKSPKADATNIDLMPLIDVSGKITDQDGNPLAGANVKVKGTDKGTTTNSDGIFILKAVNEDAILEISFIGYQPLTVAINNRTAITASLQLNIITNPEVVVRKGYYDEKRSTTVGNVSTVSSKDIEKQPVNNPLLALQGRVPGLQVSQTTGVAGGGVRLQIRGQNSINSNMDPLYIVDGVPYPSNSLRGYDGAGILNDFGGLGNPFSFLNPDDIESIDILKDADATAIYGSRGANGVVLITTKKGKPGKTKMDINVQSGIGKVTRTVDLLNTQQYLEMRHEAFRNDGAIPDPNVDFDLTLWDTTRYTDWQKVLIGGTAKYNDAQLTFSGGSANTQFLIGSGYHKETTVFPGDFSDQKTSVHISLNNASTNKKFTIGFSGLYLIDNNHIPGNNLTQLAMTLPPDAPSLYNSDGTLNWAPAPSGASSWPGQKNPLASLSNKFNVKTNNLVSNANINYELIPRLNLKLVLGYNNMQTTQLATLSAAGQDPFSRPRSERQSVFGNNNIQGWSIEPQAIYTRKLFKGSISGLIGSTIQQNKSLGQTISAFGFSSDELMEDINAATRIIPGISINSVYKYNAGFTRLNYNYQDKYIINLTARRDGSSRFGPENRFHNFASAGAAWVFSKENWVAQNVHFLSHGKLRMNYGTTGNDGVGDYSYLDRYASLTGIGVPYQGVNGISAISLSTPDLQWEETRKLEAGLDLSFLNDRIIVQTSAYHFRSSNQLLSVSLPSTTGFTSITKNLDALLQNNGLEFELRTINYQRKQFVWNSSFNLSLNRNKLLSVNKNAAPYLQKLVGFAINSNFYYHFAGVDPITGRYQFYTANGDLTFNPDPSTDVKPFNQETKYYGGLQNSFTYKNLQLDILFQFVNTPHSNFYLFNYIPGIFDNSTGNQPIGVLSRWQKPGDVTIYQRFSHDARYSKSWDFIQNSNLFWTNVSFVRLKNASLSWTLPKSWQQKAHLQNARFYAQGQNLWTLTNYKAGDPETKNFLTQLPPLKVITIGVQLLL